MKAFHTRAALAATVLSFVVAAESNATVLLKGNQKELCVGRRKGETVVDPRRLAGQIVAEAKVVERLYTPRGALTLILEAEKPFPGQLPGEDVSDAKARLNAELADLGATLTDGQTSDKTYKVVSTDPRGPTFRDIFSSPDRHYIVCVLPSGDAGQQPDQSASEPQQRAAKLFAPFRLRGELKDLSIPVDRLTEASTADVGYTSDRIKRESSIYAKGVAGYEFSDVLGGWDVTPFLVFKQVAIKEGTSKDINYQSPGVQATHFFQSLYLYATTSINLELPMDDVLGSRQLFFTGSVKPAVRFGPEFPILFGSYLPRLGPFALRPDIEFFAQGRDVLDAGANPALQKAAMYYGAGADASLRIRLPWVPALSSFVADFSYKYMQLFEHNTDFDSVLFRSASIAYVPADSPNYVIKVAYGQGRDFVTFQREDLLTVTLGVRY